MGLLAVFFVVAVVGCRSVGTAPVEDPSARGTLAGSVSGPEGVAPPAGRLVEAVEVDTGERHATETNAAGGFSFLLPPGRYRLEVALAPGESVIEEPGVITVKPSGLVADRRVILGGAGVVRED